MPTIVDIANALSDADTGRKLEGLIPLHSVTGFVAHAIRTASVADEPHRSRLINLVLEAYEDPSGLKPYARSDIQHWYLKLILKAMKTSPGFDGSDAAEIVIEDFSNSAILRLQDMLSTKLVEQKPSMVAPE